jgi:hypothetical protein
VRTTAQVAEATRVSGKRLKAPRYHDVGRTGCVALAVASMRNHTTDEGWQLMDGLRAGGYMLAGGSPDLDVQTTRVPAVVLGTGVKPGTVIVQDKREWMGRTAGAGFDTREMFRDVDFLVDQTSIFKGYVLKDAHSDQALHQGCAVDIACHFWIVYYHPRIVAAQAPFAREEHMVRTYHSVDKDMVPAFGPARHRKALLSGAVSRAYPLRARLAAAHSQGQLPCVDYLRHPGYGRSRCYTKDYLWCLSSYRVAICTSSRFGYAVRKIVEATACGCRVITDLPVDDVLPHIDGNLVRVDVGISNQQMRELVAQLCDNWNLEHQRYYAELAKEHYDYRQLGRDLAAGISRLRGVYP